VAGTVVAAEGEGNRERLNSVPGGRFGVEGSGFKIQSSGFRVAHQAGVKP
jgi:hypothetical protein